VSLFVTGTDTGVGKTYLATQLLRLVRAQGLRCAGFKPICCGDRQDAELLLASSGEGISIDELNPIWLRTPAAPFTASQIENVAIDSKRLLEDFEKLKERYDFVVAEGIGGWRVPITQNYFVSDLAVAMALPVLIVVQNKLGCLNHAMLTLESVEEHGLTVAGIVLNSQTSEPDLASKTNGAILEEITGRQLLPLLTRECRSLSSEWCEALNV
jgi:dethiobiotin synthetase